jgi:hypothetical protein
MEALPDPGTIVLWVDKSGGVRLMCSPVRLLCSVALFPAFLFGILQTQGAIDRAIASRADDTNRLPIPVGVWTPLIHSVFLL